MLAWGWWGWNFSFHHCYFCSLFRKNFSTSQHNVIYHWCLQEKQKAKQVCKNFSVIQFLASSCKRAVNKIIWVWKASEFVMFGYKKHLFSETLWRNYFQLIMAVLFIFCRKEWLFISLEKKSLLKMHKYF